jgi:hypothetical protein
VRVIQCIERPSDSRIKLPEIGIVVHEDAERTRLVKKERVEAQMTKEVGASRIESKGPKRTNAGIATTY